MFENKMLVFAVLAFVVVSLKFTYEMTYKLAVAAGYTGTQEDYSTGMSLYRPGFVLHVIVFAVILFLLQKYHIV